MLRITENWAVQYTNVRSIQFSSPVNRQSTAMHVFISFIDGRNEDADVSRADYNELVHKISTMERNLLESR